MPDCKYVIGDVIKSPGAAGATTDGKEKSVGKGINISVGYQNCLTKGPNPDLAPDVLLDVQAVCGKDPIGVVNVIKTKGRCKDKQTGNKVTRSYFVNTKPSCGTKGAGINCGIVAGIEKDIESLAGIFESMFSFGTPDCTHVDVSHCTPGSSAACTNVTRSGYLIDSDVTKANDYMAEYNSNHKEGFQTRNSYVGHEFAMPDDPIIHLYYAAVGLLMFYILLRVTTNER
jgi:hypothetical protein